jgi:hypothetical protein
MSSKASGAGRHLLLHQVHLSPRKRVRLKVHLHLLNPRAVLLESLMRTLPPLPRLRLQVLPRYPHSNRPLPRLPLLSRLPLKLVVVTMAAAAAAVTCTREASTCPCVRSL